MKDRLEAAIKDSEQALKIAKDRHDHPSGYSRLESFLRTLRWIRGNE